MTAIYAEENWVETPNGRLFAKLWRPDGVSPATPPIILIHDSLGSMTLWRDFPELLAEATARTVIAYDRLGFGQSDPNPEKLKPDFTRDEARTSFPALRNRFDVDRMILFGHSVGGAMAVGCGAAMPDDVLGIVTESAQAFVEDRTLEGIRAAKINFAKPDQRARLARYHGDKTDWVLEAWFGTWLNDARKDWTLDADLRRLQCPLLAIHGDQDEFGSKVHPEYMVEKVPAPSEVLFIDQCGHVPHREKPGLVLDAVKVFIDRL